MRGLIVQNESEGEEGKKKEGKWYGKGKMRGLMSGKWEKNIF